MFKKTTKSNEETSSSTADVKPVKAVRNIKTKKLQNTEVITVTPTESASTGKKVVTKPDYDFARLEKDFKNYYRKLCEANDLLARRCRLDEDYCDSDGSDDDFTYHYGGKKFNAPDSIKELSTFQREMTELLAKWKKIGYENGQQCMVIPFSSVQYHVGTLTLEGLNNNQDSLLARSLLTLSNDVTLYLCSREIVYEGSSNGPVTHCREPNSRKTTFVRQNYDKHEKYDTYSYKSPYFDENEENDPFGFTTYEFNDLEIDDLHSEKVFYHYRTMDGKLLPDFHGSLFNQLLCDKIFYNPQRAHFEEFNIRTNQIKLTYFRSFLLIIPKKQVNY